MEPVQKLIGIRVHSSAVSTENFTHLEVMKTVTSKLGHKYADNRFIIDSQKKSICTDNEKPQNICLYINNAFCQCQNLRNISK